MRNWITLAVVGMVIVGCSKNDKSQSKSSTSKSSQTNKSESEKTASNESSSGTKSTAEAKSATKSTAKTEPKRVEISASPKPLIIDVRTQDEWDDGHLDLAVHIPLAFIADRIGDVAADKTQKIHLHCRSGGRSGRAKTILEGLGYTNVQRRKRRRF